MENILKTKLDFLIKDINCLLWGELIYGVKYDNQLLSSVYESYVNYYFENILIKNDLVLPIQKL
jgi:hypothetical protein